MSTIVTTPPKINSSPKRVPFQEEMSSSSHQLSGSMLGCIPSDFVEIPGHTGGELGKIHTNDLLE